MKLYVDDLRLAPEGWHCVRTITEAIRILASQEVEEVSLDHDICHTDTSIEGSSLVLNPRTCPENYTAVAYYIAIMDPRYRPKVVYIHTGNPVGAKDLASILNGTVQVIRKMAT